MVTFEWRNHPDGSAAGAIDVSHKGPCAVYMKKIENAAANDNAAGDGWFRIMELGYNNETKKWCTELLDPKDGHIAAAIPKDLATGYYLLRPELLALHQADKNPPDPQFYVGCAQIFLTSDGSSQPKQTVSIPGYVDLKTPAMTYNVWKVPLQLPFPDYGPPVYASAKSKLRLGKRAMLQTIGLKPENCVMSNANWCAFTPKSYTDQTGCWAVSIQRALLHTYANIHRRQRIVILSSATVISRPHLLEARIAATGKPTAKTYRRNARAPIIKGHRVFKVTLHRNRKI